MDNRKQTEQVLDYMMMYGSISTIEAFEVFRITRLAAVIFNLKKLGYNIKTTMESRGNKRWGVYHLVRNS